MKEQVNLWKRILLKIGWVRRRAAANTFEAEMQEDTLTNVINRTLSAKLANHVTALVNERKIDAGVFSSKEYFKTIITELFGKKGKRFAEQLRIEKANLKTFPNLHITLVHTPSTCKVGQSSIIAFAYEGCKPAQAYILEHSFSKTLIVAQWEEGKIHVNYGSADDKVHFVKRIAELYNEADESPMSSFDELDGCLDKNVNATNLDQHPTPRRAYGHHQAKGTKMKKSLQICGGVVYALLVSVLLCIAFSFMSALALAYTNTWWRFILFLLIVEPVYIGIMSLVQTLVCMPEYFIVKNNKIAGYLQLPILILFGLYTVSVPFRCTFEYSAITWIMAVGMAINILIAFIMITMGAIGAFNEDEEDNLNTKTKASDAPGKALAIIIAVVIGACALFGVSKIVQAYSSQAAAPTHNKSTYNVAFVSESPNARKYHLSEDCPFLKRTVYPIRQTSIDEAESYGYDLCKYCSENYD